MQFSVIRTYCAMRFRDQGNVIVSDTDWKSYVNTAYGGTLVEMPHAPWNEFSTTLTINAGVRSATLPTDGWRVSAAWNSTDQFPLVPLEGRAQVYEEYPQQIETGLPQHYRVFGHTLEVYPLPTVNTDVKVEYAKQSGDLVADADLPIFPEAYHDLIVSGALELAYRDDGNLQMAMQYQQEYADGLRALKNEAGQPNQDRFPEIVDNAY